MQDLIKQEQFELEVLDKLNSQRLLNNLIFTGGTMLRLCFGLERFSVDLDFWLAKDVGKNKLFKRLKDCLGQAYQIKDSASKYYSLLFEIRSKNYPRALKIEIRKERKAIKTEQAIAYSRYSNQQVILKVVSLEDMMKAKIEAFLSRKEIRDCFDMEFLLKKGIGPEASKNELRNVLKGIEALTQKDYSVKLSSLLDAGLRKYYLAQNFRLLKMAIEERMTK